MTVRCYFRAMEKREYTIQDLCELTGYTRRTIRYYIQEGLLDPPAGRGRGGFYYDSHLKRLREIRALQEKGYPLAEIQTLFRKGATPEPVPVREVWVRVPLMEGVELHVSRDASEREGKKIDEIVRLARSILKGDVGDE